MPRNMSPFVLVIKGTSCICTTISVPSLNYDTCFTPISLSNQNSSKHFPHTVYDNKKSPYSTVITE